MKKRILLGDELACYLSGRKGLPDEKISQAVSTVLAIQNTYPKHPAGIILSGFPYTQKNATLEFALANSPDLRTFALAFASPEWSARELFADFVELAKRGITRLCVENYDYFPDFMDFAECFRWESLDYPDVGVSFAITNNNPLSTGVTDRLSHFLLVSTDMPLYLSDSLHDFLDESWA